MNKIITETCGEYVIITGAGKLSIDNKGTEIGTQAKIEALPEFVEMATAQREKSRALQKMGRARGRCHAFLKMKTDAETARDAATDEKTMASFDIEVKKHARSAAAQDQEYRNQSGVVGAKNTELIEIGKRYNPKQMQVKRDNPCFNQPKIGEYIDRGLYVVGCDEAGNPGFLEESEMIDFLIPAEQTAVGLMELYLARGENRQLLLSGEYIEDFRGCQYFYHDGDQWIAEPVITNLGVTKDTVVVDEFQDQAIEKKDLTPAQSEEIKFQNLSAEDKTAEFESKKLALLAMASKLKTDLEITGTTSASALTQSREFYNTELVKLAGIYE